MTINFLLILHYIWDLLSTRYPFYSNAYVAYWSCFLAFLGYEYIKNSNQDIILGWR